MKKAIALSHEVFGISWHGIQQPCAVDKASIIKYINNCIGMGESIASFKVWSNYCPTGYDVKAFMQGELKTK